MNKEWPGKILSIWFIINEFKRDIMGPAAG
jgi:hypothetical protein